MGKLKVWDNPAQRDNVLDVLMNGRRIAPCHYCDKPQPRDRVTLDHIHAKHQGGDTHSSNFVLACLSCNGRRGAMSYFGFLRLIGKVDQNSTLASEIARLLP